MRKKLQKMIQKAKKRLESLQYAQESNDVVFPKMTTSSETAEGQRLVIDIPAYVVIKVCLIILTIYVASQAVSQITDIIIMILVALFLSAAFKPSVDRLEGWGVGRPIGIGLLFFLVIGLLAFLVGTLVPIMVSQLIEIGSAVSAWLQNSFTQENNNYLVIKVQEIFAQFFPDMNFNEQLAQNSQQIFEGIASGLSNFASQGVSILIGTISAIFNIVLVLLLTFFMVIDHNNINGFFHSLFPQKYQHYLTTKLHATQEKIGEWVHGQIILFFVIGGIAYIGLSLIGVNYALTLAMVAGMAEFLPYVGPIIAFATAAPVAFAESVTTGLLVVVFYVFLQILEGNVIMPLVMKRAVGLPPLVTIIALIVGASFPNIINPILGMVLAVPVATIIGIFVSDYTHKHK